jgi:hypothetical protein
MAQIAGSRPRLPVCIWPKAVDHRSWAYIVAHCKLLHCGTTAAKMVMPI